MNTQTKSIISEAELKKINNLIDSCEYEKAKEILENKFKVDPNDIKVVDLLSEVYFYLDNIETTIKLIKKSISIDPNNNPEKYMRLAQITSKPKSALEYYKKGIELLTNQLSNTPNNNNIIDSLTSGYASIVELIMNSNLCEMPNAENNCEEAISKGLELNPNNFDILLQLSNLRIIRNRRSEAKEAMDKIYNILNTMDPNDENFPDEDLLNNLSKNYAEIEDYKTAVNILDVLIKINDQNVEYWYYLAYYHYQLENFGFSFKCLKNMDKMYQKLSIEDKQNPQTIDLADAAKDMMNKLKQMKELTNKDTNDNCYFEDEDMKEN